MPPKLALFILFFSLTACKDNPEENVRHYEMTEEEQSEAIESAFVKSSGESTSNVPEGIRTFYEGLSKASRAEKSIVADDFFSIDAMISALMSTKALEGKSNNFIKGLKKGFKNVEGNLTEALQGTAFDQFKILLVEELPDGSTLVYTRLYDDELNIVHQLRWWLVETDEGWRIYDYEDLSDGLRTISLMARVLASMSSGHTPAWITDFAALTAQMRSFDMENLESYDLLKAPLVQLRKNKLPSDIRSFASTLMVAVHMANKAYPYALAELETALSGSYDSPLHNYQMGTVMMGLEKYQDALQFFENHMSKFGRDCDTLEQVSDCHLALGDLAKARSTALEGLEDNTFSVNCLACLAAATPAEQMTEESFYARFDKMKKPEEAYELVLDYLIELENEQQPIALYKIFKKKHPESELLEYYEDFFAERK